MRASLTMDICRNVHIHIYAASPPLTHPPPTAHRPPPTTSSSRRPFAPRGRRDHPARVAARGAEGGRERGRGSNGGWGWFAKESGRGWFVYEGGWERVEGEIEAE